MRLGIDFGTTRTVVAFCDRGNYPVVSFADAAGDAVECFPSVVAEKAGELRFGFDAEAVAEDPAFTVVRSFKRMLGERSPDASVRIGSTEIRLVDLLTQFFSALKQAIATRSNVAATAMLEPGEPLLAFVATPANSHSTQRFITLDAFRRAGFEVLGLLNEPSAAGFEYTHRYRNTLTSRRDHIVVYDIGGGTFDASLLRMSGGLHEVVATSGINRLGGDDFDTELFELALAKVKLRPDSLSAHARRLLLDQCRRLKEQLHPSSRRISLDLAACLGAKAPQPELSIDVGEFYDRCAPLVARTIASLLGVVERAAPSQETDDAKLPPEVAGVYVVGGASSLPAVARALRETLGKKVHRSPYPSAAAAIGLAIAADENGGLRLSDRFSRVFGVFREGHGGTEVTFDPIFQNDLVLPDRLEGPAVVERTYRAAHNVGHFRYVECTEVDGFGRPRGDIARFSDIYFPFDASLRPSSSALDAVDVTRFGSDGPLIRETYAVGAHGIVEVRITNLDDQYELAYRLAPSSA